MESLNNRRPEGWRLRNEELKHEEYSITATPKDGGYSLRELSMP